MRAAVLAAVCVGCSFTPGTLSSSADDAAVTDDGAAVDGIVEATPDGAPDGPPVFDPATDCPVGYAITIGASPSRYRIVTTEGAFATQHSACNSDLADATHLVSPETSVELADLRTYLAARTLAPSRKYYIGAVQLSDQAAVDAGWIVFAGGGSLPDDQWEIGEPDDASGGENNAQNVSSLWVDSGLTDSGGTLLYGAVCECDGKPIDPTALAALP